jgi:hypothetical protein
MYQIIRDAIKDRACLTAHYEDYVRFFSPHALGNNSSGAPVVVAYQYGGGRKGGLPVGGDWATFYIDGLSNVQRNGNVWRPGRFTRKPIDVLKQLDIEA